MMIRVKYIKESSVVVFLFVSTFYHPKTHTPLMSNFGDIHIGLYKLLQDIKQRFETACTGGVHKPPRPKFKGNTKLSKLRGLRRPSGALSLSISQLPICQLSSYSQIVK